MNKVLHISPHFGGGVGSVLSNIIPAIEQRKLYRQELVCFEDLNEFGQQWSQAEGITAYAEVAPDSNWLHDKVSDSDIVLLHFWNHPANYHFMRAFSGKPARMALWSHVNGHHPPYLFNDAILDFPELFILATDYSRSTNAIEKRDDVWKQRHLSTVFSCSGTKGYENIVPREHQGFNIGYIGTVDYCKLHRDFIELCASVELPDVKFIVCGGPSHENIEREAQQKGVGSLFDFRGQVTNVAEVLAELDLFAYPLCPENYGTGEQVLIESMSAGVPQVTLNNGPEAYVVKDGLTGIVADDKLSFVKAVNKLYHEHDLRRKMANSSRTYAVERHSLEKSADTWLSVFDTLMDRTKHECILTENSSSADSSDQDAVGLFFLGLGDCSRADLYREALSHYPGSIPERLREQLNSGPAIFAGATRGSVQHYSSHFNDDKLKYLANVHGEPP